MEFAFNHFLSFLKCGLPHPDRTIYLNFCLFVYLFKKLKQEAVKMCIVLQRKREREGDCETNGCLLRRTKEKEEEEEEGKTF